MTTETAHQDDPNDPATASVKKSFTLSHAARATITTELSDDLDLYIVYDADNNGTFTTSEIIASSAGGTGDEWSPWWPPATATTRSGCTASR